MEMNSEQASSISENRFELFSLMVFHFSFEWCKKGINHRTSEKKNWAYNQMDGVLSVK